MVLTVADLDITVEFYTRVLGMEPVTFKGGRKALRFGHSKINLHRAGHEFEPKAARPTPGSADPCSLPTSPPRRSSQGCGVPVFLSRRGRWSGAVRPARSPASTSAIRTETSSRSAAMDESTETPAERHLPGPSRPAGMHKVRGVRSTAGRWLAAIRGAGSPPRRRDPRRVAGEAPAELGWLSGPPSIWAWVLAACEQSRNSPVSSAAKIEVPNDGRSSAKGFLPRFTHAPPS